MMKKKRLWIVSFSIALVYIAWCAADFSPTYTMEEIEYNYHYCDDELKLWYKKHHRFSLVTHDKIFYFLHGTYQYEKERYEVNLYLADKKEYCSFLYDYKYPVFQRKEISVNGNHVYVDFSYNTRLDNDLTDDEYLIVVRTEFCHKGTYVLLQMWQNGEESYKSADDEIPLKMITYVLQESFP